MLTATEGYLPGFALGIADDYSTDIYNINTFTHTDGFSILSILIRPESRGYIGLKSSKATDPPLIQPNVLSAQKDKEILLIALKKSMEVMNAESLKVFSIGGISFPTEFSDEALQIEV